MLYIVATPIGNLQDITFRAIETLKNCNYILCEDTRHSITLLRHYEIQKPLFSYHQHNEAERTEKAIADLLSGQNIALISDAGTPCISDPGHKLIQSCYENNIRVCPIPGPCAAIAALSSSPLPSEKFQFIGFLPRTHERLQTALFEALQYPGTSICYESPNRLIKTLEALADIASNAPVVVAREITKHFEEIQYSTAKTMKVHYENNPPKGEIVLLIGHFAIKEIQPKQPEELYAQYLESGLTRQEALKKTSQTLSIPKRTLYSLLNITK